MSKEFIVYRIQDRDGRGPYKPGFSATWVEYRPDHDDLKPWMYEFGPVHENADDDEYVGCGCRTIQQLRKWFTPSEYATLLAFGYRCVRMTAKRALGDSNIQCLFTRDIPLMVNAKRIKLY